MSVVWIVLVALAIVCIFIINSLIMKKNNVANAFAGIDVQLKKRYDLIPNLVAAVQRYMEHEKDVLTEVTELRKQAMRQDIAPSEKFDLDRRIGGHVRNIMVQAERYPELKASDNMMQLQRSLNEVEEQLAAARRFYNTAVTEFNNTISMIPGVFFAPMLGMSRAALFEIDEAERGNVDVKKLFHS